MFKEIKTTTTRTRIPSGPQQVDKPSIKQGLKTIYTEFRSSQFNDSYDGEIINIQLIPPTSPTRFFDQLPDSVSYPTKGEHWLETLIRAEIIREEQQMKTHIQTQLKEKGTYKLYLPDFDVLDKEPMEAITGTLKALDINFDKAICLDESNTQNAIHFLDTGGGLGKGRAIKSRASWFRYPEVTLYGERAGQSGYLLIRSEERAVIWSVNQVLKYQEVEL